MSTKNYTPNTDYTGIDWDALLKELGPDYLLLDKEGFKMIFRFYDEDFFVGIHPEPPAEDGSIFAMMKLGYIRPSDMKTLQFAGYLKLAKDAWPRCVDKLFLYAGALRELCGEDEELLEWANGFLAKSDFMLIG